jgi:hypothetical protein
MILGLSQLLTLLHKWTLAARAPGRAAKENCVEGQSTKNELRWYSWLAVLVPFNAGVAGLEVHVLETRKNRQRKKSAKFPG